MIVSHYRELLVWREARRLTTEIYRGTQAFPRIEMFGLTQQMRRAAISIVSNIAEGHGRRSPKETLHFLSIARGSLQELETQTLIATDLEYLNPAQAEPLLHQMAEVIRLLQGFIRYYEHRAG